MCLLPNSVLIYSPNRVLDASGWGRGPEGRKSLSGSCGCEFIRTHQHECMQVKKMVAEDRSLGDKDTSQGTGQKLPMISMEEKIAVE